jgi:hypothetical protein
VSTLSSTSTLDQIKAAYADNASYAEDASTTKAKAFITACRLLLLKLPKRAVHGGRGGGEEIELDLTLIAEEMKQANAWLSAAATIEYGGAGYVHVDVGDFRE